MKNMNLGFLSLRCNQVGKFTELMMGLVDTHSEHGSHLNFLQWYTRK